MNMRSILILALLASAFPAEAQNSPKVASIRAQATKILIGIVLIGAVAFVDEYENDNRHNIQTLNKDIIVPASPYAGLIRIGGVLTGGLLILSGFRDFLDSLDLEIIKINPEAKV